MSTPTTPLYLLVNQRMRGGLPAAIRLSRHQGVSWAKIADRIRVRTGIAVSDETLRRWAAQLGIPDPAKTEPAA